MLVVISGYEVLVDKEDYDEIKGMKWYISPYHHKKDGKMSLYVECGTYSVFNGKSIQHKIRLHRFLMGCLTNDGKIVDHIDGNTLNNQRSNLRICSAEGNAQNRGKNVNNSSGYKGVTWDKVNRKWMAQVQHKGKSIKLGRFNTPEEAHQAYIRKVVELHGEFVHAMKEALA